MEKRETFPLTSQREVSVPMSETDFECEGKVRGNFQKIIKIEIVFNTDPLPALQFLLVKIIKSLTFFSIKL